MICKERITVFEERKIRKNQDIWITMNKRLEKEIKMQCGTSKSQD